MRGSPSSKPSTRSTSRFSAFDLAFFCFALPAIMRCFATVSPSGSPALASTKTATGPPSGVDACTTRSWLRAFPPRSSKVDFISIDGVLDYEVDQIWVRPERREDVEWTGPHRGEGR